MALPVVFLPGIMGSRLFWTDGSGRRWDPDSVACMLEWAGLGAMGGERLAKLLNADAPARVMRIATGLDEVRTNRGWGGVIQSYYRPLLKKLEESRLTIAVGYDWRQSLLTTAQYVSERLDKAGISGTFDLVTHSMGGLLARAVLAMIPDVAARVHRVVHLCQPCLGVPVMYRRMFTGALLGIDGSGLANSVFFRILGVSGSKFLTNVCGLPGAIQLLPTDGYRHANSHFGGFEPPLCGVYGDSQSPPGLMAANATQYVRLQLHRSLELFSAFHARVGGTYFRDAWYIIGDGLETDTQIQFADGTVQPVRSSEGDGTVPTSSASPLPGDPATLQELLVDPQTHRVGWAGVEHSAAPADKSVINAVVRLLD